MKSYMQLRHVARKLWPQSRAMQRKWLRAVACARQGKTGWVLDHDN